MSKTKPIVGVIIQARMGSTRLPGKILLPLLGRPMIEHLLCRLRRSKFIDRIILATSSATENNPLEFIARNCGALFFRGDDENNVLRRYFDAAQKFNLDIVVRVTGDCPLIDAELIDEHLQKFLETGNLDYWSTSTGPNTVIKRTYPHGLDFEIFTLAALKESVEKASDPEALEHVSPYITEHPEKFRIHCEGYREDLSKIRITVDYPEDYEVVRKIFERLYPQDQFFGWKKTVEFYQEAQLWRNQSK